MGIDCNGSAITEIFLIKDREKKSDFCFNLQSSKSFENGLYFQIVRNASE